ncbi:MAG TPA: hypothetical protein VKT50_10615, partial [Candidatus Acidoferrales bacterium]|nr:hypothetical protein [Candidatus Acidoferrales bacterium]
MAKRGGAILLAAIAMTICAARAGAQVATNSAHVVRYHATNDNVKYDYCVAPAVAHVHSGDIIEANTLDCFGDAIQHPGDTLAMAKGDNPLTGPFYIDGAEPGDT